MKFLSAAICLLLLIFGTGMAPMVAEARLCETPSHNFKGLCFSSNNCGHVCKGEGFNDGACKGFRLRCICSKHCV
ncbi:defensin J1-2-like [Cucurbita maxima]|uniref:Defensin J1-2-like n=2 Tax=Cucurbita TaxID=3660 RepID=A0A6J1K0Q4_CUCMA|nr:defensin J1-2-like isoform X2 [Cucurbita moschata]XP_022939969.1 defensin J1-2-like isoform X3 [Cucurbita moschata]XP_022992938.1 defensin J1-2-like [Cucurbita maxima]